MKKMNKIMITALGAVLGMSVGTASAADISGSIYGGLQQVSPSEGDATMNTYGIGKANITGELAEKDGWSAKGTIKLEMTTINKKDDSVKVDEAFLTLSGPVDIIAGITDIGGPAQGNSYTSEKGTSKGNVVKLGNKYGDIPLIGIGLDFGLKVAVLMEDDGTKKTTVNDVVYTLSGVENLSLGVSYESEGVDDNGTTTTDTQIGLGVAYKIGNIEPFFNYGSYTPDGGDAATAMNLGVDVHELGPAALTAGLEIYNSGVDGADPVNYMYLAAQTPLGPGTLTFQFFSDGTKDKEKSEITLEFSVSI